MADSEEKKGPSKKELKKLAKKAEKDAAKAAKKQAPAGEGKAAAPSTDSNKEGDATAGGGGAAAAATSSKPTTFFLGSVTSDPIATLKAAWAATLFGVPVSAGPAASASNAWIKGPILTASNDEDVLVFGGNGVAKALCLLSGHKLLPQVDEWLEWERTTFRSAIHAKNAKKITAALTTLENALKPNHVFLSGEHLSLADVVVVSTLSSIADQVEGNVVLSTYLKTHMEGASMMDCQAKVLPSLMPPKLDNPSILKTLEVVFLRAISSAFPDAAPDNAMVSKCNNTKFGDYQCNAAMSLFASLKASGSLSPDISSPQKVAQKIVDALGSNHPVVEQLNVNGPGFILFRISAQYLTPHMNTLIHSQALPKVQVAPETCVVDFSSPNIAKEMHVGHLRSTILGESICRLLEYVGHKVHRVNHVGDWGTQFGMLIQFLKDEYPNFEESMPNITDLTEFYKSAKAKFDESPEFKKLSQTNVVKLQSGDEECLKIWHILCDVSRKEFQKVYNRLDVTTHECGESFYNERIPGVIQEFDEKGLLEEEEGGAKVVRNEGYAVPLMLQKTDGGYGYDSTDMAALKYRIEDLGASRIIVVTDYSQGDHFKMCNMSARKIGWAGPDLKLEHIGFGTVQGEDGKRFKTRSGDTVRLVDLLDEAVHRMETSLTERIKENKANITAEQVPETAAALGYGAVKYFDLRRNPTSNYIFSYDRMLDTKGNTAIYLLYAHARLESIMTKAKVEHQVDVDDLCKDDSVLISLDHPSERNLAMALQMFTDTIEQTLDDLYPYHICDYLYSASIAASEFVTQCKVLGSPEMKSRLLLCRATTLAMRQCFDLLAIRHVMSI